MQERDTKQGQNELLDDIFMKIKLDKERLNNYDFDPFDYE